MQKELVRLYFEYEGNGTPYGNTFNGFMEWLIEKQAKESSNKTILPPPTKLGVLNEN